jgi:hypothetical protein
MDMGVTCAFINKPLLLYNKVENMFTRLLQNTGNMTLLFTVDIPVDRQYHKLYCLKNKE